MSDEYEPDYLDEFDPDNVEQLAELSDDELAEVLDGVYDRTPLAGYCTPVTRRSKPRAFGRPMVDLPPL
ncbi:hypothetical protein [Streptomyces misionensis]|uniref:hypothetical protein n=1 Tax=Streptomyces misionensis TaxID=67331 RepID=UPI00369633E6